MPRLRAATVAVGLAGGGWGVLAGLEAEGVAGWVALALAALALAGALLAPGRPALACALLYVAAFAGFLAVGGAWIGPGLVQTAAALAALAAIESPFAAEIAREREARAHGRPR